MRFVRARGADAVKLSRCAFRPLIGALAVEVLAVCVVDEGSGVAIGCGRELGGAGVVAIAVVAFLINLRAHTGNVSSYPPREYSGDFMLWMYKWRLAFGGGKANFLPS